MGRVCRRRIIAWVSVVGVVCLALILYTVLVLRSKPTPFRFLANATVVKQEEWMEGSPHGPQRLKTGGEYRVAGSLAEVEQLAQSDFNSAQWKVERRKENQVTFISGLQYVTLLDRPQASEVKVIIQTYREPTYFDRIRLWMQKRGWVK